MTENQQNNQEREQEIWKKVETTFKWRNKKSLKRIDLINWNILAVEVHENHANENPTYSLIIFKYEDKKATWSKQMTKTFDTPEGPAAYRGTLIEKYGDGLE